MDNRIDVDQTKEPYQLEKESKKRWLILIMTFSAIIITFIDRVNLSAAAPGIMKEFDLSPAVMGVVFSAFAWSYTLMQIPGGYLTDRFGLRKTFTWSFGGWSAVTILTSFVTGLFSLTFWRTMLGAVEAPLYPGMVRLLNIWFKPTERAFAMSICSVALNFGLAIGVWLAAVLILTFGWRPMFFWEGVLSLIIIPLWWYFYREATVIPKATTKVVMADGTPVRWYTLMKNRNVMALTIGYFGVNYSLFLFISWLPSYFIKEWGFPLAKTGMYAFVVFGCGIIGKPFFGWLSGYLIEKCGWSLTKSRKSMLASLSLFGASIGIVAIAPYPELAAILLIVAEVTGQASGAICWATAADIAPQRLSAQVGGILNLAAGFGGIIAPMVTGFLLAATGSFYWPLMVAAGVMVVSAACYTWMLGKVESLDNQFREVPIITE